MIIPCLLLLFASTKAHEKAELKSLYQYYQEIDAWLKLHINPATWEDAMTKCYAEGGFLAAPTSIDMLVVMQRAMDQFTWPADCGIFLGVHATHTNDYYTVDGKSFRDLQITAPGFQDHCHLNKTKYLVMRTDGTVMAATEQDHFPFICYKKRNYENFENNTSCETLDPNYFMNSRTGSCYKFHKAGKTWFEAAKTCAIEGGYLAIINTQYEARVLNDLFMKYPPNVIASNFRNTAMIGILEWKSLGIWTTIHGQLLRNTGYVKWSPRQPDGAKNPIDGRKQKCGGIIRSTSMPFSTFDDVWCDKVKMAFICEKPSLLLENLLPEPHENEN